MDLFEAVRGRRSIRAFKPNPVPRKTIEDILELTINAPSANNLQPWEFVVVADEEKDRLSRTLIKAYRDKQIACGSGAVKPLPEVFRQRGVTTSEQMRPYIEKAGVTVDNFVNEGSCDFYGAPVAIIICLDDCFSEIQMIDVGTAVSYLILVAHAFGLATCPIGLIAAYADEIKDLLNIPENKYVVIGVALGYPDWDNHVIRYKSSRDSLTNFVRWIE